MKTETAARLNTLNRVFYEEFGDAFASTRRRIQPGVRTFLETVSEGSSWLDLGCGAGALAVAWAKTGRRGSYSGRDFSHALLAEATEATRGLSNERFRIDYNFVDLHDPAWAEAYRGHYFDGVACFAALHHIPGRLNQLAVMRGAASLLRSGGEAIFSVWQFQNSPKLMERVLPWETVGIDSTELEMGDTLLDWRFALPGSASTRGLRYVHLFTEASLAALAEEAGLTLSESYYSDGKSGNLALYQRYRI